MLLHGGQQLGQVGGATDFLQDAGVGARDAGDRYHPLSRLIFEAEPID